MKFRSLLASALLGFSVNLSIAPPLPIAAQTPAVLPASPPLWQNLQLVRTIAAHQGATYDIKLSADGSRLATVGYDGLVKVWEMRSGALLQTFRGEPELVFRSVAIFPDGRSIVTHRADGLLQIWEVDTAQLKATLPERSLRVGQIAVTADGQTIVDATGNGTNFRIKLWDANGQRVRSTISRNVGWVDRVAISADGYSVAAGSSNNTTRVWNLRTGEFEGLPERASVGAIALAVHPNGQGVGIAYRDGSVKLWEVRSGAVTTIVAAGREQGRALAFSADGQTLAIAFQSHVRLWNVSTNRLIRNLPSNIVLGQVVQFSPDRRTFLSTDGIGDRIRVWQLR